MANVTAVIVLPATGDEVATNTVTLTLTLSSAVTIANGDPSLVLNDGGVAAYDAGSSTSTSLVFHYTVASSENTPALAITSVNLNGGTVTDNSNSTAVDFSAAVTGFDGLQVNTGWGLFEGADQNGSFALWATDTTSGSSPHTRELNPFGASSLDFNPQEITALGSEAVFNGTDGFGHRGLWVTDGTSANTTELTTTDVDPQHLYAYGNYVVFEGTGADGHQDLWVSDGTVSGTHVVSPTGAYSGGIFANAPTIPQAAPDFTGIGNVVLFNGTYADANHPEQTELQGLWAFNGTTATLLSPGGASGDGAPAFDPQHMFSYGGKVYFFGYGTHGQTNPDAFIPDLWVTDGTSNGTVDIGVGVTGASEGLYPRYFAAVSGRVAFSGYSGPTDIRNELWVTDGTTGGTTRLTFTDPGEIVNGITPQFLTSLGEKIVFSGGGIDGSSARGLWVSDGTIDGTTELSVGGAYGSGLFTDGTSPGFTAYGDIVLFAGKDSSGLIGLWKTDATANGTVELLSGTDTVASPNGLNPTNFSVVDGKVLFTGFDDRGNSALFEYDGTNVTNLGVAGAQAHSFFPSMVTAMEGTLPAEQTPCFCLGTKILTLAGEVPVEQLRVGDHVITVNGEERPITWIGHGRRPVALGDNNARPLIVRRNAVEDGMPWRDLYLTRGHGLYIDGLLIPVEFLVNGRSILWDEEAQTVEFYHLELPEHDVIFADGMPTESYREDGNRDWFDNADPPFVATSETPWLAPVVTGGPELDRVWRRLLDRSGFAAPATTDDPDLHLVVDGRRIEPLASDDPMPGHKGLYRFHVEQAPQALIVASHSAVPQLTGVGRDPRRLGVAGRSIRLAGDDCSVSLDYASPLLSDGFNGPEVEGGHRWTDGCGRIPETVLHLFSSPFEVAIEIVSTTKYPSAEGASPSAPPRVSMVAPLPETRHAPAVRETRPDRDPDPVAAAGAERLGRGLQQRVEGAAAAA